MRFVSASTGTSVVLVLVVASGLGLLARWKYLQISAPMPAPVESPEVVGTEAAVAIQTRSTATAVGTILSPRSIQLRTELVGTIARISFKPGQIVEADQVLLEMDSSVERAQLDSALAMRQVADSTYKRTKQAFDSRAISDLELEQSVGMLAQAKSEVSRLEAIIRKKTLRAPFRAAAGLFDVHEGQYLPEGTPITMLQGIENYAFVDFMMPQQVADFIHAGDSISILSSASEVLSASVVAVDSQADKLTRNVMARARVESPPATMQPNDSVKLFIEYGPLLDSVRVPFTSVRSAPTGSFVYIAEVDSSDETKLRARTRNVLPGRSVGENLSILSGLKAGERVVTDGSFKLRDGVWIVPVESQGP